MRKKDSAEKYEKNISAYKVKCKCGHVVVIRPMQERTLCSWCGYYVFRTKASEFKYRMMEEIKQCNVTQ